MLDGSEHQIIASGWSIACRSPSSGCPTMAAVMSPARHAASLATSASNRERRQSKVHRAMEWPKLSSVRSSVSVLVSPCPDEQTVMNQLSAWINHYNEVHP